MVIIETITASLVCVTVLIFTIGFIRHTMACPHFLLAAASLALLFTPSPSGCRLVYPCARLMPYLHGDVRRYKWTFKRYRWSQHEHILDEPFYFELTAVQCVWLCVSVMLQQQQQRTNQWNRWISQYIHTHVTTCVRTLSRGVSRPKMAILHDLHCVL